jgi:hypothetical protein
MLRGHYVIPQALATNVFKQGTTLCPLVFSVFLPQILPPIFLHFPSVWARKAEP